jgi:hypothetical protein
MSKRWRDTAEFSPLYFAPRFVRTFSNDGRTIDGRHEITCAGTPWEDDLQVTHRRMIEPATHKRRAGFERPPAASRGEAPGLASQFRAPAVDEQPHELFATERGPVDVLLAFSSRPLLGGRDRVLPVGCPNVSRLRVISTRKVSICRHERRSDRTRTRTSAVTGRFQRRSPTAELSH